MAESRKSSTSGPTFSVVVTAAAEAMAMGPRPSSKWSGNEQRVVAGVLDLANRVEPVAAFERGHQLDTESEACGRGTSRRHGISGRAPISLRALQQ